MDSYKALRHEQQREEHQRRDGERRRAKLDTALMESPWNRRECDRRAETARRKQDRIEAAKFNHALMKWHDARERNAA